MMMALNWGNHMTAPRTEALHDKARGLDERPLADAAAILIEGQVAAARALEGAEADLSAAAQSMADTIRAGGVLHYVAAGSSGLMAAADAQELGGTYAIPATQLRIHMAGGLPTGVNMPGGTEDETSGLSTGLAGLTPRDTVIAVSASGTTPYTLEAARLTRAAGAALVGIANNPGTPLLEAADHPICLPTPPEVISGSTRMGAGTAQKIALNALSTLMAIVLGHVHDGMMVNLRVENAKLRARAVGMVTTIAGVGRDDAEAALQETGWDVKPAIVMAATGLTAREARDRIAKTNGRLRAALARDL